jgi:ATP-dependent DNA helicase RecQ
LLTEIETIVDSGTKINLSYLINEILEDYQIEELDEVLTESEEASFQEMREEFDEDEYTDEELRMSRIQFISNMGN